MFYKIAAFFLLAALILCGEAAAQIKPEIEYYINGGIKLETVYNKRGEKNGLEKFYYPTGELWSRTTYYRDRKDGVEKLYYKSGSIMRLKPYNRGLLDGMEKAYWKNGELMEEIPHKNGVKQGAARYYNMDGSLFEVKIWESNELKDTIPASDIDRSGQDL